MSQYGEFIEPLYRCLGSSYMHRNQNLYSWQSKKSKLKTLHAHIRLQRPTCVIVETALHRIFSNYWINRESTIPWKHSGDYRHSGSGILTEERYECSLNYWNWSVIISENSCLTIRLLRKFISEKAFFLLKKKKKSIVL